MHTDPHTPDLRPDNAAPHAHGRPHAGHEAEDERPYGVEPEFVEEIVGLLRAREREAVLARLDGLHAADIADLIEQAESAERADLIDLLPAELDGEVLSYLNPDLHRFNSDLAERLGCATEVGPLGSMITVDEMKATNVREVYAAGDVTRMGHTVTFACADGVMAALAIHRSLVFGSDA